MGCDGLDPVGRAPYLTDVTVNPLMQALLAVLLIVLMTGMGATLRVDDFRNVARDPRGVLIGVCSQFGWMPLIAFGLAKGFGLAPELAIGLILVGSTPGGTTSNLFTFFARADLALSISMTAMSTLIAVVAMPLVLHLYAAPFTSAELSVPLGKIAVTLALILVPVGLGMLIRAKRGEEVAAKVELAGTVSGVAVLLALVIGGLIDNGAIMLVVPGTVHLAAVGLGVLGMLLGWGTARLAKLTSAKQRAIAFETGIQNSALAIAIVLLAFPAEQAGEIVKVPLLYALYVLVNATIVTWVVRAIDRRGAGSAETPETPN